MRRAKQNHFFKGDALDRGSSRRRLGFAERVYAVVCRISRGKTMTYKQVAAKAGNPRAARAVGRLMSRNLDPKIPCHRVVRSDGKIGGYNRGGPARKMELLLQEAYTKSYGKGE